ncbi:acetylxylan esterase [Pelagicoccus sp. NFK12]|uniref:Acetylxylan esterase n=1 Tax=Pelagicoccus enzymogenes TaxID=2773457 RepID=A0A927IG27_9BACT|nr:acetylxylan esterase [Pelagicoccus enzymogenes]MBD5778258.1 acetylxylan esterase [Pelagicoccus enzymogenes]
MNKPHLLCLKLLLINAFVCTQAADNPTPLEWTTTQDHQNMMEQLGITELRPGRNGWAQAGEPNAANYDESQANPYPDLPELLVTLDGSPVATAHAWRTIRRPELIAAFESEVYGRIPQNVPEVDWRIEHSYENLTVDSIPAIAQRLAGVVDNSAYPEIDVSIDATLVLPQKMDKPAPVLIMFGWKPLEFPDDATTAFTLDGTPSRFNEDPPSFSQLIAAGWGIVYLIPTSYQADNGAGLTRGIIGLVNKGQPRQPDDWGALRAWGWGASRCLDYLETRPEVNVRQVGIEGVSRYGKAALVTHAFDERFAVGFIASSGAGGVALHRRNFGESTENLASSGAYHWFAGNYIKYATEKSRFGRMTPDNLPVDSHQLIALCAPRPTFVSYGIPENGDALWLDQQGSYMATVAASPAFALLGAQGLGETKDYRTAPLPPVNQDLLDGELAWRQHDGGHESQSNMKHFLRWAEKKMR